MTTKGNDEVWIPTSNDATKTATRNVEPTQYAADDLRSGHSRERKTFPDDEKDVLAFDVTEEPKDNYDEDLSDPLNNTIDLEAF